MDKKSIYIQQIINTIINKIEGGYFHPDMLKDGRVRDGAYNNSGETMFGLDRKAGIDFTNSPAGKTFWSVMDSNQARYKWPHNYFGGNLYAQLLSLVTQTIEPFYDRYSSAYLTPEARGIVSNNYKLSFNFIYATFNGPKWFKYYAGLVNNAIKSGNKDPEALATIVINARINSDNGVIKKGGNIIKNILMNENINNYEKERILEMHINATKKHYLFENENIVTNYDSVWDYKEEDGKYYAKKKGNENWILASGNAAESIKTKVYNKPSNVMLSDNIPDGVSSTNMNEIIKTIVKKLEGGYYHPDMLKDGRVRDSRYGNSGETMFGMDRLRGGDLAKTPAGERFWSTIDNANARKYWKWNYYGGNLESQLIELASQMIQPFYDKYSKLYLSAESINIVNNNYKLKFNFVYAVFNGPKLFKHLASLVNKQVASGNTSPESLARIVLNARLTSDKSLYRQTGQKIKNILGM